MVPSGALAATHGGRCQGTAATGATREAVTRNGALNRNLKRHRTVSICQTLTQTNRIKVWISYLSMIFSENRFPLFGIMLERSP
jgi:hypothetical protein